MENLGSTFQLLRKSRNLSLDDLAGDIVSKSQISRFENHNVKISFIKMHYLVSRLHMSMDEFISFCNGFYSKKNTHYLQHLHFLYSSRNFSEITRLYKIQVNLLQQSQTKIESNELALSVIFLKTFLYGSDSEKYKINKDEIQLLTDYLFSIENWGQYEIYFLGQSSFFIPYNTYLLLSKEIINNKLFYEHDYDNKLSVGRLAVNSFTTSLEQKDVENSIYFSQKAKSIIPRNDYLAKTALLFNNGWLAYLRRDFEEGKEMMKKGLHIFRELDQDGYYQHFSKDYKDILKEYS